MNANLSLSVAANHTGPNMFLAVTTAFSGPAQANAYSSHTGHMGIFKISFELKGHLGHINLDC